MIQNQQQGGHQEAEIRPDFRQELAFQQLLKLTQIHKADVSRVSAAPPAGGVNTSRGCRHFFRTLTSRLGGSCEQQVCVCVRRSEGVVRRWATFFFFFFQMSVAQL